MFEIKIMIEAPELSGAMMRLADAISARPAGSAVHSPTAPAAPAEPAPAAPKKETKKEAKPAPAKAEKPAPAPQPEPVKAAETATTPAPAAAAAPAPQPAPAQEPAPAATAAAPTTQPEAAIDLSVIARAGAGLVDQGKMPEIMNLLKNYNVRAITELKQEQYSDFARDLRALGAAI